MLTTRKTLDLDASVDAGCAWFAGRLWIGACAPDGRLLLRWVDVLGSGTDGTVTTSLSFGGARTREETVALAAYGNRMWIAFGRPHADWFLSTMSISQVVAPAIALPIEEGILGPAALVAYAGGVALMWTETYGRRPTSCRLRTGRPSPTIRCHLAQAESRR